MADLYIHCNKCWISLASFPLLSVISTHLLPALSSHRTNRLQRLKIFVRPFRLEFHVPTRISQWPTRHLWRNIHRFTTDPYLWFRLRRLQWWQGGWFHIGNNRKSKKTRFTTTQPLDKVDMEKKVLVNYRVCCCRPPKMIIRNKKGPQRRGKG